MSIPLFLVLALTASLQSGQQSAQDVYTAALVDFRDSLRASDGRANVLLSTHVMCSDQRAASAGCQFGEDISPHEEGFLRKAAGMRVRPTADLAKAVQAFAGRRAAAASGSTRCRSPNFLYSLSFSDIQYNGMRATMQAVLSVTSDASRCGGGVGVFQVDLERRGARWVVVKRTEIRHFSM